MLRAGLRGVALRFFHEGARVDVQLEAEDLREQEVEPEQRAEERHQRRERDGACDREADEGRAANEDAEGRAVGTDDVRREELEELRRALAASTDPRSDATGETIKEPADEVDRHGREASVRKAPRKAQVATRVAPTVLDVGSADPRVHATKAQAADRTRLLCSAAWLPAGPSLAHLARVRSALAFLFLFSLGRGVHAADVAPSTHSDRATAASLASGNRLRLVGKLGSGNNQHAYLVAPRAGGVARVLKIFQAKPGLASDPAVREELANIEVNTARALGEDAAFQARFGDIIPRADVAGVGATIQDHVDTGVPLAKLGASQRQLAESEAQAAIALAKERLGGVPTSANVEN